MTIENYVKYEEQYIDIVKNILNTGFREKNERTGEVVLRTPAAINR